MVIKAHELEYISKNNSSGNPSHVGRVENINYWINFDKREIHTTAFSEKRRFLVSPDEKDLNCVWDF